MFRMPAEWEPQDATWVSWPHNKETWPENLAAAQTEFVDFVGAIAADQPVNVMAGPLQIETARSAMAGLSDAFQPNVRIVEIETNDAWARDYAPTFVKDRATEYQTKSNLVSIDWHYNAWGGKYPPYDADQAVASQIANELNIENRAAGLCFEGGAIEINESGCVLTTTSCGLNINRNPNVTKPQFEAKLHELLGASKIVWMPGHGIEGDDTDGHIDQLARFTSDNRILFAWTNDADDPRRAALTKNYEAIVEQLPEHELSPLILPQRFEFCGREIPASYCNFLITNGSVIVPQFDVPEDKLVLPTLAAHFPTRKIVPLPSRNLSVGLGSFHCLSQQQPSQQQPSQ